MKSQKGFTLIELMVVIVIIGILSALAVPKMFGTSAKAKAAEAPTVIASWEVLESAYGQERGSAGAYPDIGFTDPSTTSKWFTYADHMADPIYGAITATPKTPFGDCAATDNYMSTLTIVGDVVAHTAAGTCAAAYSPNF